MKAVYIAHPLRGRGARDEEMNRASVTRICAEISAMCPNVLVFSPLHNYSYISGRDDQFWVLHQCRHWLMKCDELWVYGDWESSDGCVMEVDMAQALGKKIVFKDGGECE